MKKGERFKNLKKIDDVFYEWPFLYFCVKTLLCCNEMSVKTRAA